MNVEGNEIRSIWLDVDSDTVRIIDQQKLPHRLVIERIDSIATMVRAIRDKHVRGTELLFMAGAYGVFIAAKSATPSEYRSSVDRAAAKLRQSCPSSFGLAAGIQRQLNAIRSGETQSEQIHLARDSVAKLAEDNMMQCLEIGQNGLSILDRLSQERGPVDPVNVLTNGNAGALASVDIGTATAPIFAARDAGIRVHVWITESRPHLEGARLTAWEFEQQNIEYTVVPDNAAGYLLSHGQVDVVLAGVQIMRSDGQFTGYSGAYFNALAAADNSIPYYIALTPCAIDWGGSGWTGNVSVTREGDESVRFARGLLGDALQSVLVTPRSTRTLCVDGDPINPRLITGLITHRGICRPEFEDLLKLFPEKRSLSSV